MPDKSTTKGSTMSNSNDGSNDGKNDQNNAKKINAKRRDFLKATGAGILGAALASRILMQASDALAQAGAAGGAAPSAGPVKENDPQAQALGYHADAKKVETKKWAKRAGPEGAKQFCYNCQFYQAKGDAKASKSAPCQIFAGKEVLSKAWCNSWTQNPNVKG
jgi:hypothetical protein